MQHAIKPKETNILAYWVTRCPPPSPFSLLHLGVQVHQETPAPQVPFPQGEWTELADHLEPRMLRCSSIDPSSKGSTKSLHTEHLGTMEHRFRTQKMQLAFKKNKPNQTMNAAQSPSACHHMSSFYCTEVNDISHSSQWGSVRSRLHPRQFVGMRCGIGCLSLMPQHLSTRREPTYK